MRRRGIEAVASAPRSISTRRVFNIDGRPVSWVYFQGAGAVEPQARCR
jgi:hypothetical protein